MTFDSHWWDTVEWWSDPRLAYARGLDEARGQFDLGWLAASEAYGRAILAALERPEGHGGVDLDHETRNIISDIFERYAGVPRFYHLVKRELACGCNTADVVRDHGRLHGALIIDPGNRV